MSKAPAPRRLDIPAFARDGATLQGAEPLAALKRLMAECAGTGDGHTVNWHAQGALRARPGLPDEPWLHLQADAVLPLICQRCLAPADIPFTVDRLFRFVADEATAQAEDDDAEEDLLVVSHTFDLLELVEDELLMELPAIPRHEVCPGALPVAEPESKPNPFAVLAGLKNNKSS